MRFASIDIGTNSVLLLIVEKRENIIEPIWQAMGVPRVGRNLAVTGEIAEASFDALMNDLSRFQKDIHEKEATLVGVVATQAFRVAKNGEFLMAKISAALGINAVIIAGPEESRLGYMAIANRYASPNLTVLDIGGGSTELTQKGHGMSLPIGAVSVFESFKNDQAACRAYAKNFFQEALIGWTSAMNLIVVGGTASALAMMELKLEKFDAKAIEGLKLEVDQVTNAIDLLAGLSETEKRLIPGMDQGRIDILMPGLCILESLLLISKTSSFRVSDRGIRYGVILDWLKNQKPIVQSSTF